MIRASQLIALPLAASVGSAACHPGSGEPRYVEDSSAAASTAPRADRPDASRSTAGAAPGTFMRGMVVLRGDTASFAECGSDRARALIDATGRLGGIYEQLAPLPGEPVYAEIVARLDPAHERDRAAPGTLTALELRRVSPAGESSGCARTDTRVDVLARGNEPFWSVSIYPDRIVFREPENLDGFEFPLGRSFPEKGRHVYRWNRDGPGPREIEIVLEETGCTDSMSGEYLHLTATVTLDGRVYSGCGVAAGVLGPAGR